MTAALARSLESIPTIRMTAKIPFKIPPEVAEALDRACDEGLIGYFCDNCLGIVFLTSNLGPKPCLYCAGGHTMRVWGRVTDPVFAPEPQVPAKN